MILEHWKNFIAIIDAGTITAASKKLLIAQPALSNQLKKLEQLYGTQLVIRQPRRLELTDAGMILYQKAKRMCEIEQSAQNEIASGFSGQKAFSARCSSTELSFPME